MFGWELEVGFAITVTPLTNDDDVISFTIDDDIIPLTIDDVTSLTDENVTLLIPIDDDNNFTSLTDVVSDHYHI